MTSTVYYTDELVTLYHADCLEELAWLAADVLVTDPPYGLAGVLSRVYKGRRNHFDAATQGAPGWDEGLEARDTALALWGARPYAVFGSPKRLADAPPYRAAPLIWDKASTGQPGDTGFPWYVGYELIYVHGSGWHVDQGGQRRSPILRVPHTSRASQQEGHPTPKPVALMGALIRCAPPGVIADPFCGSGATLRAAKDEGRPAVGVEVEEAYCERAALRLTQEVLPYDDEAAPSPDAVAAAPRAYEADLEVPATP